MPNELEDFLFAIPAVQELMFSYRAENRDFEAYIRTRPEFARLVRPALSDGIIVNEIPEEILKQADLAIDLDRNAAYAVCSSAGLQAAKAYGALLGAAPGLTLPVLGEDFSARRQNLVWMPRHVTDWNSTDTWPNMHEFQKLAERELGTFIQLDPNVDPMEALSIISGADMCIGVAGGLTLMAVALGKPLVELYPPTLYSRWWACKWDSPDYRVFVDDLYAIEPQHVWNSAKALAAAISGRRRKWESKHSLRKAVAV